MPATTVGSKYHHFDTESLVSICKNNFISDEKMNAIISKVHADDDTILDDLRSIQSDVFDPDDIDGLKDLIDYVHVVQKKDKEKV